MVIPAGAGDRDRLRVSDADREQAAERLRQAAGDGRITLTELDERLELAYAARTYADLDAVTSDLPGPGVAVQPAQPAAGQLTGRIGGTPGSAFSVAVLSGAQRAGSWVVPAQYTAVAIMGGVELDLRQARFAERTATISAFAVMGGISIIVPEDIEVDVSGFACMGGFDHTAAGPGVPGAPCLRITGCALMGGVDVRRKAALPPGQPRGSLGGQQTPAIDEGSRPD